MLKRGAAAGRRFLVRYRLSGDPTGPGGTPEGTAGAAEAASARLHSRGKFRGRIGSLRDIG